MNKQTQEKAMECLNISLTIAHELGYRRDVIIGIVGGALGIGNLCKTVEDVSNAWEEIEKEWDSVEKECCT